MKAIKCLLITMAVILTVGWTDSTKTEYSETLKNGFTCDYKITTDASDILDNDLKNDITRFTVKLDPNGDAIKIIGENGTLSIDDKNTFTGNLGDKYKSFEPYAFGSNILNWVTFNTDCPDTIYIYNVGWVSKKYAIYFGEDVNSGVAYVKQDSSKVETSCDYDFDDSCHVDNATSCSQTYSFKTNYDDLTCLTLYFELGKRVDSNCGIVNYLAVSKNSNLSGAAVQSVTASSGDIMVNYGSVQMMFNINSTSISEMYPTTVYGNNYVSSNNFGICYSHVAYPQLYIYNTSRTYPSLSYGECKKLEQVAKCSYEQDDTPTAPTGPSLDDPINLDLDVDFCIETYSIWRLVGYILYALKIMVPLLIIIFGSIDFAKAVISNDNKASTEAAMSLVRRIIAGFVIFFVPTVISFLLSLINSSSTAMEASEECQVCLLRPFSSDCDGNVNDSNQNGN